MCRDDAPLRSILVGIRINHPENDGSIGELFLSNHRAGSDAGALARDAAVAVSLGLQGGVPLHTFRGAILRDPDGSPSTPLGHALDLIAAMEGEQP